MEEQPLIYDAKYYLTHNQVKCEKPKYLPSGQIVPCGNCELCIDRKRKEWTIRNQLEFMKHKDVAFLTLTFDDEHLLQDTSYRNIDIFLKRLRNYIKNKETPNKNNIKIKYFGAYENGDKTNRPHYHIVIYGYYPTEIYNKNRIMIKSAEDIIRQLWTFGKIADIKRADINAPLYLTQYLQKQTIPQEYINKFKNKKEFNKFNKWSKDIIVRQPFVFMSKGLGFEWLEKNKDIIEKNYINQHGYKKAIPKGFKQKIQNDNKKINNIIQDETTESDNIIKNKTFTKYIEKNPTENYDDPLYLEEYNIKLLENYKAQANNLKIKNDRRLNK